MEVLSSYKPLAVLAVSAGTGEVEYRFRSGDVEQPAVQPDELVGRALELVTSLDSLFFSGGTTDEQVRTVADGFLSQAVPNEIAKQLKEWNGAVEAPLLVVEAADDPRLVDLPWELISAALGGGLMVVRHRTGGDRPGPELDAMTLLMAGWSVGYGGQELPGVKRELEQTPKQISGERVQVAPLQAPTVAQLVDKAVEVKPDVVHLVTANGYGLDSEQGSSAESRENYLWLGPVSSDGGSYEQASTVLDLLPSSELVAAVNEVPSVRLCVVNTMPNPPGAVGPLLRTLIEGTGAAVFGWIGNLEDSIGADFSVFLYSRLIEGATLPEAVRSFVQQFAEAQWVSGAIPVIWVPSMDWVSHPVLKPDQKSSEAEVPPPSSSTTEPKPAPEAGPELQAEPPVRSDTGETGAPPVVTPAGAAMVTIEFAPQESLFPSLLINGQDALRSLTLTAREECDVLLEISCDAGGRSSEYRRFRSLLAGANTIDVRNVGFPVLYELMTSNEPRIVNFQVAVSTADGLVAQTTRSVRWRARREWLDSDDSHAYLPSFVLPMSRAVSDLIHDAEAVLTQIGRPQESFSGYKGAASADRHVRAIYQAMRAWGLKYITPPGAPVFILDPSEHPATDGAPDRAMAALTQARVQSGQLVRFPDDIVERRHATCHDLSLMFAAAIEYVNLRPIIALLPGHTLIGFWTGDTHHDEFWSTRSVESGGFGARWKLKGPELVELVNDKKVTMVETTKITSSGASWDEAKRQGVRHIQQHVQTVIDVRRSRESIQPLSYG